MQIKPATARGIGFSGNAQALYDPETNIRYGMKYLAQAQQLAGGDLCGTILRYNAGHGARRMNPSRPTTAARSSGSWDRRSLRGRAMRPSGKGGIELLAFCCASTFIRCASRPGGRARNRRKAAVEESPGSTETRCRITSGGGDPRESATESRPPADRG
jgi:hypothetical protein